MRKLLALSFFVAITVFALSGYACNNVSESTTAESIVDSTQCNNISDTTLSPTTSANSVTLTEKDYQEIAEKLGIEVAAIKAVVEIEAGQAQKGFWAPGKPIINYDMSIVNKYAPKLGVNLSKYRNSHPEIWGASRKKYGSQQATEWARFEALRSVDNTLGIYGCFWGMFQIGGFNWKLCGTNDVNEFFNLMCRSERDQLELFANLIVSTDMVKYLKAKNWAGFASRYNGPSYAKRGYHTRMAKAYNKYKNQ